MGLPGSWPPAERRSIAVISGVIYIVLAWTLGREVFLKGYYGMMPPVWFLGGFAIAAAASLVLNRHAWQLIAVGYLAVGAVMWAGASTFLAPSQFLATPGWQPLTVAYIAAGLALERLFRIWRPDWASKSVGVVAAGISLLIAWVAFPHLETGSRVWAGLVIIVWLGWLAYNHECARQRFPGKPEG